MKLPSSSRETSGKALKPLLLFELGSSPGAPTIVVKFQPVVEAIDLAILFPEIVPS